MKHLLWLLALVALPALGLAQKKPGEAASIKTVEIQGDVKPGTEVIAVVQVQLEKGFHTHSHQPSEEYFIATVLTVTAPEGVKAGAIRYPAGKTEKVKGLDKPLSVFGEQFQLAVPLTLGKDVTLPLRIPATLSYQACQGAVCFPPQKLKFELTLPGR